MVVKAISPKEARERRTIPDAVMEVWNALLIEKTRASGCITIKQKEIVERLQLITNPKLSYEEICEKGWVDVEDVYRKAGWKVEYDRPGFNETYEAFFEFSPKRGNARDDE